MPQQIVSLLFGAEAFKLLSYKKKKGKEILCATKYKSIGDFVAEDEIVNRHILVLRLLYVCVSFFVMYLSTFFPFFQPTSLLIIYYTFN